MSDRWKEQLSCNNIIVSLLFKVAIYLGKEQSGNLLDAEPKILLDIHLINEMKINTVFIKHLFKNNRNDI